MVFGQRRYRPMPQKLGSERKRRGESMIEPIVKSIEVPCDQKTAFEVFLNEMDSWWPLAKFTVSAMAGKAAASIRVDSRLGGEIVEVGPDGEEYLWGHITHYDP